MEVNIKEARGKFSALIDQVERGAEITLTRRGKEVARLGPPPGKAKRLPRLDAFRKSLKVAGDPLSKAVTEARAEERC